MVWVRHVARIGAMRYSYKKLAGKLGRTRTIRREKYSVHIDLGGTLRRGGNRSKLLPVGTAVGTRHRLNFNGLHGILFQKRDLCTRSPPSLSLSLSLSLTHENTHTNTNDFCERLTLQTTSAGFSPTIPFCWFKEFLVFTYATRVRYMPERGRRRMKKNGERDM
jgi:hypothetical protein